MKCKCSNFINYKIKKVKQLTVIFANQRSTIHFFPLLHRKKERIVDPGRGKERIVDPWYQRWLTAIVEIIFISLNSPLIQLKNFHFNSEMVPTACNRRITCLQYVFIDMVLLFSNLECLDFWQHLT